MSKRLSFIQDTGMSVRGQDGPVNNANEWDIYAEEVNRMSKKDARDLYNTGMERMKNLFNVPGKTLESPADAKAFFQQSVGRGVLNEKYGEAVSGFDLDDNGKVVKDEIEGQPVNNREVGMKLDRGASLSRFEDIVKADESPEIGLSGRTMGELGN